MGDRRDALREDIIHPSAGFRGIRASASRDSARAGSPRVLTRKLIFFAAVPARRAFFAPRVRTRGKISTSRARGARARLNSNEASFPSGRRFRQATRARVGRRPSSRASRDARARRTATRARVPRRRRRRRRRRPTRSSRARRRRRRRARRRSSSAVAPRPPETSHAVDGAVFNLHFTRQRGNGLFLFRMSIHIHMSNVFKCPYVYYLRLSHDSSESS